MDDTRLTVPTIGETVSFVLMRHKITKGEAKFAEGAVDHARTLGWEVAKPPKRKTVPDTSSDAPAVEPESPAKEPDTGRNKE